MENKILDAIQAEKKTGLESIEYNGTGTGTGFTLLDFWKWSYSDLTSNATRGQFAEFLVGSAIGIKANSLRIEWDAFDLTTEDGIKVEVKSASYLQTWEQKDYSKISFSIKSAQSWNLENKRTPAKRHADVYVFCLLKHLDQQTINPLNANQWEFYVLPTCRLDSYTRSVQSITINSLRKLTSAIEYSLLKETVHKAFITQKSQL